MSEDVKPLEDLVNEDFLQSEETALAIVTNRVNNAAKLLSSLHVHPEHRDYSMLLLGVVDMIKEECDEVRSEDAE